MFSIKSTALKIFCSDIIDIAWKRTGILSADEAHVYCFNISEADRLGYLATGEEHLKASFFRQDIDAKRFLAGRILTKRTLAGILDVDPGHILIHKGKNGKPFAMYNGRELQSLHFNISHSGNLVIIGVCSKDIGVDVEEMKGGSIIELSATVFSGKELNIFEKSADTLKTFYTFWTRKEAILKATGQGLIDSLYELEVLDGANESNLLQNNGHFDIISFEPAINYRASICITSGIKARFLHSGQMK
ncbi:4'-phosphopantetheinyl transferase family protein [Niabella aquatica]